MILIVFLDLPSCTNCKFPGHQLKVKLNFYIPYNMFQVYYIPITGVVTQPPSICQPPRSANPRPRGRIFLLTCAGHELFRFHFNQSKSDHIQRRHPCFHYFLSSSCFYRLYTHKPPLARMLTTSFHDNCRTTQIPSRLEI